MNFERYSLEKAEDEAAKMRSKIESGEAWSYPEAGDLVEQEETKKEQKRIQLYDSAKRSVAEIFDGYQTGERRVEVLLSGIKDALQHLENPEKVAADIRACSAIEEKDEFTEAVFRAGKPILDLEINRPEIYSRAGGNREFIKLSDLLSYHIGKSAIHIHAVPDGKVDNFLRSFKEGMAKMAGIVEVNSDIKTIEATSWIVADHPKILERMGFAVTGEISEELRRAHFLDDKRKIYHAFMTREDFLKRYLKQ